MHPLAAQRIDELQLSAHPEGGYFREIFRSAAQVDPRDGRGSRAAVTTIYFLLAQGEVSRWHRVASDEVWHFYEGAPLELLIADGGFTRVRKAWLGPLDGADAPVIVVPAGAWQAARSSGDYTLVGCTVGPGFDFTDFALLHDIPELVDRLRDEAPEFLLFV